MSTPQNGQTDSNNLSANRRRIICVWHFMGLALKGLRTLSKTYDGAFLKKNIAKFIGTFFYRKRLRNYFYNLDIIENIMWMLWLYLIFVRMFTITFPKIPRLDARGIVKRSFLCNHDYKNYFRKQGQYLMIQKGHPENLMFYLFWEALSNLKYLKEKSNIFDKFIKEALFNQKLMILKQGLISNIW